MSQTDHRSRNERVFPQAISPSANRSYGGSRTRTVVQEMLVCSAYEKDGPACITILYDLLVLSHIIRIWFTLVWSDRPVGLITLMDEFVVRMLPPRFYTIGSGLYPVKVYLYSTPYIEVYILFLQGHVASEFDCNLALIDLSHRSGKSLNHYGKTGSIGFCGSRVEKSPQGQGRHCTCYASVQFGVVL